MSKIIFMLVCFVSSLLFTIGCCIDDKDLGQHLCNFGFAILDCVVVFILAVM